MCTEEFFTFKEDQYSTDLLVLARRQRGYVDRTNQLGNLPPLS
jgi:hypothetical protein